MTIGQGKSGTCRQLTEAEQAEIGRKWAKELCLRPHLNLDGRRVPDTWHLRSYGWKTSLGLYRTICRMVDESRGESDET